MAVEAHFELVLRRQIFHPQSQAAPDLLNFV